MSRSDITRKQKIAIMTAVTLTGAIGLGALFMDEATPPAEPDSRPPVPETPQKQPPRQPQKPEQETAPDINGTPSAADSCARTALENKHEQKLELLRDEFQLMQKHGLSLPPASRPITQLHTAIKRDISNCETSTGTDTTAITEKRVEALQNRMDDFVETFTP